MCVCVVLCVRLYVCERVYVFLARSVSARTRSACACSCITYACTSMYEGTHTLTQHTDTHLFKIGREFVLKCLGEQVRVLDNVLVC